MRHAVESLVLTHATASSAAAALVASDAALAVDVLAGLFTRDGLLLTGDSSHLNAAQHAVVDSAVATLVCVYLALRVDRALTIDMFPGRGAE